MAAAPRGARHDRDGLGGPGLHIEIQIQQDGLVVWVNIDGVCVARILANGMIPINVIDLRNNLEIKPWIRD